MEMEDRSTTLAMTNVSKGIDANNNGKKEHHQEDCDDDFQYIFPQRLMSILLDEKNHDAICWLPHGKGFVIRNRKLFEEKIMPKFFSRKSKYSSFTRKLNRW
jgi:HSF-type DNA-binding